MEPFVLFNICIVFALIADLCLFNKAGQEVSIKKSLIWTGVWIAISCAFGAGVWCMQGAQAGSEFFTAYVMEKTLSVDNLFVIMLVFSYFKIQKEHQHRALFYGVLGVIVLRGIFVIGGVEFVQTFDWMLYVFGALLIYLGFTTMTGDDDDDDVADGLALRIGKRLLPWEVSYAKRGNGKFFVTGISGVRYATPLFLAVIVIELSDIIFAVDSIPVVVSVTSDKFIAYSSNILAVLGLRSLYFAFQGILDKVEYLKYGIGSVLIFIGTKMLLSKFGIYHVEALESLLVVLGLLSASVMVSLVKGK